MIVLSSNTLFLHTKIIYFASYPILHIRYFFSTFRSTATTKWFFLFKRESINTLLNDITLPDETLLRSFKKQTVYEIHRSIKDGLVHLTMGASMDDFISIYNRYAAYKGWRPYEIRSELADYLCATVCRYQGTIILAHLYFLDPNSKRVCLEATVSDIWFTDDVQLRALIGRSNRHLHYADMLYFKSKGFEVYDFGGYDNHNLHDPKKNGINKFKESFNGRLVYESNYISYPLYALFGFKRVLRSLHIID